MAGKVLIAEMHRFLVRHHMELCSLANTRQAKPISDVQLRRLLALVDQPTYQRFHSCYFGWHPALLSQKSWISFDGKELRGTIDGVAGQKRGLCLVRPVLHQSSISLPGIFYSGMKDSEIICLRTLLQDPHLASRYVTFDALHTQPCTLEMIQNAQGTYVAQVKANQALLLEDLQDHITLSEPIAQKESLDKGHGRIERRNATFYSLEAVCFETKWDASGMATLIVM